VLAEQGADICDPAVLGQPGCDDRGGLQGGRRRAPALEEFSAGGGAVDVEQPDSDIGDIVRVDAVLFMFFAGCADPCRRPVDRAAEPAAGVVLL